VQRNNNCIISIRTYVCVCVCSRATDKLPNLTYQYTTFLRARYVTFGSNNSRDIAQHARGVQTQYCYRVYFSDPVARRNNNIIVFQIITSETSGVRLVPKQYSRIRTIPLASRAVKRKQYLFNLLFILIFTYALSPSVRS